MATTRSRNPFRGGAQSFDDVRRRFIEAPLEAARLPAMATALEVASLYEILPDAFMNSRRRELARITAAGGDQDPRAVRLQNSLDQLEDVKTLAQRSRTRLTRMASVREEEEVFHGFVSDIDLNPMPRVTVRVSGGATTRQTATTDDDGYFRIELGTQRTGTWTAASRGGDVSDRITGMFARLRARASKPNASASASNPQGATVEVLQGSTVLHRDPVPLVVGEGRNYREYILGDEPEATTLTARFARSTTGGAAAPSTGPEVAAAAAPSRPRKRGKKKGAGKSKKK